MNDVLVKSIRDPIRRKRLLKGMLWTAAKTCSLGGLFGWVEDHWLRVERLDMPLRGLGPGLEGATIAQISDLHCSPIVRTQYLRHCVDRINAMGVDFVALTGDFITGPPAFARRVGSVLKHLQPRVASLACLGNHDYGLFHPSGLGAYRGLDHYVAEQLARADVFVMRNEARTFTREGSTIQFVGLEDFWSEAFDPAEAFETARPDVPTVALCHNPDPAASLARLGAQWVLAGHTHGSPRPRRRVARMIFPTGRKRYRAGAYPIARGATLYVNRGLSYGRRDVLNPRPEITVFTMRRSMFDDG